MSCDLCTDPDGASCFPIYGVGPHIHTGSGPTLGRTVLLPPELWPDNYRENPEDPGHGVWWCPHCGDGKPRAISLIRPTDGNISHHKD